MSNSERGAREYGDVPPHEQVTMLDFSGEFLRQAQQAQDSSGPGGSSQRGQQGSPERHGSLEPDDSRKVTGALGGGAVRTPGGADQQQGGERWGGQQSQSQGGQGQAQQGGSPGQAFTAEEAARGPEAYGEGEAETAQAEQSDGYDVGEVERQSAGMMDQQGDALDGFGGRGDGSGSGGQHAQFAPAGSSQQGGGWESGSPQAQQDNVYRARIREHMEVIGADGVHLGTVDAVDGNRIKLTKPDSGMGSHRGHHHYIGCALVAEIEGNTVRLSATAANAYSMEEEE